MRTKYTPSFSHTIFMDDERVGVYRWVRTDNFGDSTTVYSVATFKDGQILRVKIDGNILTCMHTGAILRQLSKLEVARTHPEDIIILD